LPQLRRDQRLRRAPIVVAEAHVIDAARGRTLVGDRRRWIDGGEGDGLWTAGVLGPVGVIGAQPAQIDRSRHHPGGAVEDHQVRRTLLVGVAVAVDADELAAVLVPRLELTALLQGETLLRLV